jgi:NADH:ubiquinone oxidoreductase subunit C
MSNEELKTKILAICPEAVLTESKQFLNALVPREKLHEVALKLKESEDLAFDYLFCLSGADFPEYMTVIYHLESTKHRHLMVLRVNTADRENPEVDTVCDIWRTAEFHEREVYDLLGVKFSNHPDLRRLLLWEGWGYPLRKDYVDEVRIVDR